MQTRDVDYIVLMANQAINTLKLSKKSILQADIATIYPSTECFFGRTIAFGAIVLVAYQS